MDIDDRGEDHVAMGTELYDAIVVVTVNDFKRMRPNHKRVVELLPVRRILFCGNEEVGEALKEEISEHVFDGSENKVGFILEDDVLHIEEVKHLWECLKEMHFPDGTKKSIGVGWYYQQFLKYAYAFMCKDKYYLAWDGDTVPCKPFSMFSESGVPYFDYKREHQEEYFITMNRLLNIRKVMAPSFISEHMLFKSDLVKELISQIESNDSVKGNIWWEKILYSIRPAKMVENSFSEFETYGTYVAVKYPEEYRLREWHSLRYAGMFFQIDGVTEKDWNWLGRDFSAASFEKFHTVRPDTDNLFNNPRYQQYLSPRQVLEAVQEEFKEDALFEVWDY